MDRAGNHSIGSTVAESLCSSYHGNKFNSRIEAFVFEKTKLVGGQSRKTGIADEIDGCDAHLNVSPGDVSLSVEFGEANIAIQGYITIRNSE